MTSLLSAPGSVVGAVVGAVAGSVSGAVFGAVARARGRRGLHPRGGVLTATLHREGLARKTGVPWLDDPGEEPARVRLSRAVGLPPPLPDVLGLGVRVAPDGVPGDLLLSTAGRGRLARHVLRPARSPWRSHYTSIVPFGTPTARLMVGARPEPGGFALEVAGPGEPWRRFARLAVAPHMPAAEEVDDGERDDQRLALDPVLHPVPGLEMPAWLARVREPAYAASRRARYARQR